MLKKLPKLHTKLRFRRRNQKSDSGIISGGPSGRLKKYNFNKFHALAMVVVFVGLGYVLIRTFASPNCYHVCTDLPEYSSVKSDDFQIRTRVRFPVTRSSYNIVVILDRGSPHEQVVDVRRETKGTSGNTPDKIYNFYFGNPASGGAGDLVFDRQLLTPGQHTVTTVLREGSVPGQGSFIAEDGNVFTVTNVKNLMTSREAPKTFYATELPRNATNLPRNAVNTQTGNLLDTVGLNRILDGTTTAFGSAVSSLRNSIEPFKKVQAHTSTAHGTLGAIVYVDDPYGGSTNNDRRQGNVTIYADIRTDRGTNCHNSSNPGKREATLASGPYSYYRIAGETDATQGDNHGKIHFYDCPTSAGYNYSVGFIMPNGYHLHPDSQQVKTVDLTTAGTQVQFTIRPNDDDGDGTPNYRDNCPNQAGLNSNGGCPTNPACAGSAVDIRDNFRTGLKRFYNGSWNRHHYQMQPIDQNLMNVGFCVENNAEGWLYPNDIDGNDGVVVPLHRFWKASSLDHFYTLNFAEGYNAGYNYEGAAGYVAKFNIPGTTPLYRLYRPSSGNHFYTTNSAEVSGAIGNYGYAYEGNEGYVWAGPANVNRYQPTQPPLLSMTGLTSSAAYVNLFGNGMDDNGYPGLKTLNTITAKVDGVVRDSHSIAGRSNNTLIGEVVQLGNIADGRNHTVQISASTSIGATTTMTFYVNSSPPQGNVLGFMVSYKEIGSVEYISATTNRGAVKVQTYENTNENTPGDPTLLDRRIGNVSVYAENYKSVYHCGDKPKTTSYKTSSSTGAYTFTACPVGNVGPSYKKAYYIYAKIPAGYHVDNRFLIENDIKLVPLPGTNEIGARRKVSLYKDKTRTYSFVFAKNQANTPPPPIPASATAQGPVAPAGDYDANHENYMVELINSERTSRGIPALSVNPDLVQIARSYVYQENTYNFFAHVGYNGDATCTSVFQRGKAARDDYSKYGENLAYIGDPWYMMYGAQYPNKYNPNRDPSLYDSYHGYMNSPAHRDNIIDREYTSVGVGTIKSAAFSVNDVAWTAGDPGTGEAEGACSKVTDKPRAAGTYNINAMEFAGPKI